MKIERSGKSIRISQEAYFDKILRQHDSHNDDNHRTNPTPMAENIILGRIQEGAEDATDMSSYQSAVGSLMYATTMTRPDIAQGISTLSRFLSQPMEPHRNAVNRAYHYLRGTKQYGITYQGTNELCLYGYSDASYAACPDTRRSTSGYIFFLAGGPISWKSKRQNAVALSSTETEYIALCEVGKEAVWLSIY